jgi:hypothetical protein
VEPDGSLLCSRDPAAGPCLGMGESSPHLPILFPKIHSNIILPSISRSWGSIRFPSGAGNFSLHPRVRNCSGARPASCPVGARGSFPGVKRPGREADHLPPSSAEVKERVELYLHSPNMPSWHGAQFKKHRDYFTFTYTLLLFPYS